MDFSDVIWGFVVGWSVASVSAFVATLFYMPKFFPEIVMTEMIMMMRKKKKKKKKKTKQKVVQGRHGSTKSDRSEDTEIRTLEKCTRRMSFQYLCRVTEDFKEENVIGLGKLGTMYKATLENGNFLAVKRFKDSNHLEQQFMSEIMSIGRLRHRNIIPLPGFCIERKKRLLVYNYMANGSLYDWLHPMEAKRSTLEWPMRVRITIGIAKGLAWLHHNCKYRVTHGNICSKCILLDKNFDPKISNFEEAIMMVKSNSNSNLRIFANGESRELDDVATKYECIVDAPKIDVYAFGILLLEVVTSEKPENFSNLFAGFSGTLVEWITYMLSTASFYGTVDKSLIEKGYDGEIFQFLKVASNCIHPSSIERPTMQEVYKILSSIGARNGITDNFGISKQVEVRTANHMYEHTRIEIVEDIE